MSSSSYAKTARRLTVGDPQRGARPDSSPFTRGVFLQAPGIPDPVFVRICTAPIRLACLTAEPTIRRSVFRQAEAKVQRKELKVCVCVIRELRRDRRIEKCLHRCKRHHRDVPVQTPNRVQIVLQCCAGLEMVYRSCIRGRGVLARDRLRGCSEAASPSLTRKGSVTIRKFAAGIARCSYGDCLSFPDRRRTPPSLGDTQNLEDGV